MGARCLAWGAVSAALVGCAGLVTPIAQSTQTEPAVVRITVAPRDVHGTVSLHEEIRYVRISGTDADIVRELEPDGDMRIRLPGPGTYDVGSWTRSCGDTCATLHPARHRCEASFTAAAGAVARLEIRFPIGRACAISVGHGT